MRTTPVPCFAVIFSSKLAGGHDREYAEVAERMVARASAHPGFLGIESCRDPDGFGVTVSYWRTEDDVRTWKADAEHQGAQAAGRDRFYERYTVHVARVERAYGYTADGAPPREAAPPVAAPATLIDRLEALAREIGAELLAMQRAASADPQALVLRRKGAGDLVTRADEHAHHRLVSALAGLSPGTPLVLEESATHEIPSGPFFVCDELDGTINFSRGRPGWGVSIARVDGEPTHGVFHLPALGVTVTAVRGEGCRVDGVPVRLAGTGAVRLTDAVAACELNPHHTLDLRRRYVDPVTTQALTSTAAACAVEAAAELLRGRTDLYLNCRGAKIWDFAATALAVTEAGGRASDLAGHPLRWDAVEMGVLFAANDALACACLGAFHALPLNAGLD